MRRIMIALTGIAAALGLAIAAAPANADVTPLGVADETGAWAKSGKRGASTDTPHVATIPASCQPLNLPSDSIGNPVPARSLVNRSATQTVQYYNDPGCTTLVATLTPGACDTGQPAGMPNALGTMGAQSYIVIVI